jgi:hypothetical protein
MIRTVARGAFALVLMAAVVEAAAQPPAAPDKVYYRDKKDGTIRSAEGELKPAPAGFQVGTGKTVVVISPLDIVRVVPGDVPPFDRKDILAQVSLEERKEWGKARDGYVEMKKSGKSGTEKSNRFLEFKIAQTSARAADDAKDVEGWQPRAEEAAKMLDSFVVGTKTGWEAWAAVKTAAGLQVELGQFNTMADNWAKLAAAAPGDLKNEALLNEIDAKVRGKRYDEAKGQADKLFAAVPEGVLKRKLAIYQIAGAKALTDPADGAKLIEAEIAKTQDPAIRATGYSMIGELYLAGEKPSPRDAMWAFLWVEVVYNQDKDEVLTALVRLAKAFADQGDEERSKAYREKARRLRAAQG